MNFLVIIPARLDSKRFPKKLLADIHGKPMIVRVMEKALKSGAKKVIVATDSIQIAQAVELEKSSTEVCLTQFHHRSGIERLEEVAVRYKIEDHQIIVHLQGDEPLITSSMIYQVAHALRNSSASMATLATPIHSWQDISNCNIVKVVMNVHNHALYFSRSIIPWCRYQHFKKNKFHMYKVYRHIGIYSYYTNFLHRYVKWEKSPLEIVEMLEQLRVLWQGEKIYVSLINDAVNIIGVDTVEMLSRVNKFFQE